MAKKKPVAQGLTGFQLSGQLNLKLIYTANAPFIKQFRHHIYIF